MAKKRIAINGFGRIGRLTTRILTEKYTHECEVVAINDLSSSENLAYLFNHDTTYRQPHNEVSNTDNGLFIGQKNIPVYAQKNPELIPWRSQGVDLVIEATGFFRDKQGASKHISAGANKVLISAPSKSPDIPTVVLGVNTIPNGHTIYSNASCTTNCLAPALKAIHDDFTIIRSSGVTVHAYTSTQKLQDSPDPKDFRKARAAASNIIPTTTGAAKAIEQVMPELQGKLTLSALRVPVMAGSLVQIVVEIERSTTKSDIIQSLEKYASNYPDILQVSGDPLVSSDIIQNPHSCIVDSLLTTYENNLLTLFLWYDNEWGYSNRLADLAIRV